MYKNRAGLDGRLSAATWAYKIATNKLIDHRKNSWNKIGYHSGFVEKNPATTQTLKGWS